MTPTMARDSGLERELGLVKALATMMGFCLGLTKVMVKVLVMTKGLGWELEWALKMALLMSLDLLKVLLTKKEMCLTKELMKG